ncbi:MAG: plastocyanin/azurin family copper-binding protein [Campylobacterota bacterium]|nr:plastocyanin/azurin family copper-binding protein [Campylobacterota bacterium]
MKKIILSLLLLVTLNATEHIVDQKNKTFLLGTMKVKVGDTITFKNSDPFSHNAYTDDEANEFDVGMQATGTETHMKVKKEGEFHIECAIHPNMLIKVKAEK